MCVSVLYLCVGLFVILEIDFPCTLWLLYSTILFYFIGRICILLHHFILCVYAMHYEWAHNNICACVYISVGRAGSCILIKTIILLFNFEITKNLLALRRDPMSMCICYIHSALFV